MAKLTKQIDRVFNNNHPNGINIPYTKTIETKPNIPIIGECYYFGTLRTSIVEDFKETNWGFLIETENSVYLIEN
jgi:hypothetical protein